MDKTENRERTLFILLTAFMVVATYFLYTRMEYSIQRVEKRCIAIENHLGVHKERFCFIKWCVSLVENFKSKFS